MALIHIGFWFIYWCLQLLKFSMISKIDSNLWIDILTNLFCGTLFFYVLTTFVLPQKTKPIRIFKLILNSVLAVSFCLLLRRSIFLLMAEYVDFKDPVITNLKYFLVSTFDLCLKFGTYAILVWFFQRQAEFQKQMLQKKLEEERLRNELLETKFALLQTQINPHFLFNTLNFIYSKAISSDDHIIEKTVLLLSDILHHSIRNGSSGGYILVNEEMSQIKKLYELNCLRFDGNYYLNIIEERMEFEKRIPQLILLTFFENMMKHGIFNNPEHPGSIHVKQSEHLLEIHMKNMINHDRTVNKQSKNALGKRYIKNVLDKYYENNYELQYYEDGIFYQVNLKIQER